MKMKDEDLVLCLDMITLDKLVLETDAPYMGFKGCRSTEAAEKKRTYPNVPASLLKVKWFTALLKLYWTETMASISVTRLLINSFIASFLFTIRS